MSGVDYGQRLLGGLVLAMDMPAGTDVLQSPAAWMLAAGGRLRQRFGQDTIERLSDALMAEREEDNR